MEKPIIIAPADGIFQDPNPNTPVDKPEYYERSKPLKLTDYDLDRKRMNYRDFLGVQRERFKNIHLKYL